MRHSMAAPLGAQTGLFVESHPERSSHPSRATLSAKSNPVFASIKPRSLAGPGLQRNRLNEQRMA